MDWNGRVGRIGVTTCGFGTPTTACWTTGVSRSAGGGICVTSWVTRRVAEPIRRGGAARVRRRVDGARLAGAVEDPPVRRPPVVTRVLSWDKPG